MKTPKTTSMDLPPILAAMLQSPVGVAQPKSGGLASGMGRVASQLAPQQLPRYQAGGMVGPGGQPMSTQQPGQPGATSAPMDPQMLEMQLNQFAAQHPQQVAQIQQVIQQALQSGELTTAQLNQMVQLATVAAQNPDMYPSVRNAAIQAGLAGPQDIPEQYDLGLLFVILLAGRALQQGSGAPVQSTPGGGMLPSMAKGGEVPNSRKADGSVPIMAHEGEYVIPRKVVEMKGKEFFDSLVEKYKDTP